MDALDETFVRRFVDNTIELSPIIADHTDIFNHHIVDQPLSIDSMQAVVQGECFVQSWGDNARIDLSMAVFDMFAIKQELGILAILVEGAAVGFLHQGNKELDELCALGFRPIMPMDAQGSSGQFPRIKVWQGNCADFDSWALVPSTTQVQV